MNRSTLTFLSISFFILASFIIGIISQTAQNYRSAGDSRLGYAGPGMEISALYLDSEAMGDTRGPVHLATKYGLSFAFQRQVGSRLVTVFDPGNRFDLLADAEEPSDSSILDGSFVLVSEIFGRTWTEQVQWGTKTGPHVTQVQLLGNPRVMGDTPGLLVSKDIQPPSGGVYYFAGERLGNPDVRSSLLRDMEQTGFEILDSIRFRSQQNLAQSVSVYYSGAPGVVVLLIGMAVCLGTYAAVSVVNGIGSARTLALAVTGASRKRLRKCVAFQSIFPMAVGHILAALVAIGFVLQIYGRGEVLSSITVVLSACLFSCALSWLLIFISADSATRKASREVIC